MSFDLRAFHERAVRTPSHEDPAAMRDLLVEELDARGHAPRVDDAGNVLAERGAGEPHYVLNTHLDTVPPHVAYRREGETVYGRGACDAKGPLAALLAAFLSVDPAGCGDGGAGRLTLAVTPDEETTSLGAAALDFDADGYVVGEPTDLDVCNAARGRFQGTVTLAGEAAHAAEREGANAVAAAEGALAAVRTFDDDRDAHDSLGRPLLTPTTIEGGEATNQVPARCDIVVDRRSVPPETAEGFRAALEAHLREHVAGGVDVSFALTDRESPFLEAFATDPDESLVDALADASGGTVRPFGAATEASYFAADAPTVVFGPGVLADDEGAVAHSAREYVRLPDVEAAAGSVETALRALY